MVKPQTPSCTFVQGVELLRSVPTVRNARCCTRAGRQMGKPQTPSCTFVQGVEVLRAVFHCA